MREENELAEENGYESPILGSIEETHKCYNDSLKYLIENSNPNDYIFIATHNYESVDLAKNLIIEKNIKDGRVRFG